MNWRCVWSINRPATPAMSAPWMGLLPISFIPGKKPVINGLLAHNYLAGRYFFNLQVGDIIDLVFGDGDYSEFEITEIKSFQALEPDNPYSSFVDLESGKQLSVNNVFIEVYMGSFHTTLQTCIANGSETEWGRQFILAPPLD